MDRQRVLRHPQWCANVIHAGGLSAGERVLVLVDEPLAEEGSQLVAAVKDAGGEPRLELWAGEVTVRSPRRRPAPSERPSTPTFLSSSRSNRAATRPTRVSLSSRR